MRKGALVLIAGMLIVGLVAGGCGGGDGGEADTSTSQSAGAAQTGAGGAGASAGSADGAANNEEDGSDTAQSPKATFVERATAICEETAERLRSSAESLSKEEGGNEPPNPQEAAEKVVAEVLVPNLEAEADEIRSLDVPGGDEAQVEAILDGIQQTIDRLETDPKKLAEGSRPLAEAEEAATEYGLTACPLG